MHFISGTIPTVTTTERPATGRYHELGAAAVEMEAVRWRKSARPSRPMAGHSAAKHPPGRFVSPVCRRGWRPFGPRLLRLSADYLLKTIIRRCKFTRRGFR